MPVILQKYNLAYFPVPKVACSSIKHLFFFLEHGRDFEKSADGLGKKHGVHDAYPSKNISQDNWSGAANMHRIAVVRDPVDRFMSSYCSRVLVFKELSEKKIDMSKAALLGLKPDPDLFEFIDNLESYSVLSPEIKHHTAPQSFYLGHTLEYFSKVYRFEELDALQSDLRQRTGQPIALPHVMKGIEADLPSFSPYDGTIRLRKILEFYSGDYALLKGIYSPEAATRKYISRTRELLRSIAGKVTSMRNRTP